MVSVKIAINHPRVRKISMRLKYMLDWSETTDVSHITVNVSMGESSRYDG